MLVHTHMRQQPKPKPSRFGVSLRKLRRLKKFTISQLAEQVGKSRQTIDAIETGLSQSPSVDLASQLAAVLGAQLITVGGTTELTLEKWP